ncbi:MAG TPA: malate synthase A, partial [Planctomycetota bacterium]|nr:malate synthase A [Planctomycetota bacterium]
GLVAVAREEFDRVLTGPNQLGVRRDDVRVAAAELVAPPGGAVTEAGVRKNLNVGVRYLAAWLEGNGCVPIDGLMEDAATAEISRVQLWQWIRHRATLDDGRVVTEALVFALLNEELRRIEEQVGRAAFRGGRFGCAVDLFRALCSATACPEFLTLQAYRYL